MTFSTECGAGATSINPRITTPATTTDTATATAMSTRRDRTRGVEPDS